MRASNQAADNHVITIFAHRKPSNSEKLLTFPQFYYVFDQESFRISHIFLFLYVLLFLLVVVTVACFLFSITFISRQYTVNRIFVQSALKQRQDVVVFFCFLLISTSFNSIEKYFYHSFLYLLSTLFM